MMKKTSLFKKAFLDTIPVLSGYMTLGIGYGLIMYSKGYGLGWTLAMSTLVYAGSMQYAAVDLFTGGASLPTAALMTLLINARHLFYGISMVDRWRNIGKWKPYLIFGLTDETYSLVSRELPLSETETRQYDLWVTLLDHIYWVSAGAIGSLLGSLIRVDLTGIDFALTALFVSIFVDQWKSSGDHIPALMGLGITAGCLLLFGSSLFLIPAMVLILGALMLRRKRDSHAA